jgi:hypothetical protein
MVFGRRRSHALSFSLWDLSLSGSACRGVSAGSADNAVPDLAAACFARSSPRFENWLLAHPRFGPLLTEWRARGAIPRKAKFAALAGMIIGFAIFRFGGNPVCRLHWRSPG